MITCLSKLIVIVTFGTLSVGACSEFPENEPAAADTGADVDACTPSPQGVDCSATSIEECEAQGCRVVESGYTEYLAEKGCVTTRAFQECVPRCGHNQNQVNAVCVHSERGTCVSIASSCGRAPDLRGCCGTEAQYDECVEELESPACP